MNEKKEESIYMSALGACIAILAIGFNIFIYGLDKINPVTNNIILWTYVIVGFSFMLASLYLIVKIIKKSKKSQLIIENKDL